MLKKKYLNFDQNDLEMLEIQNFYLMLLKVKNRRLNFNVNRLMRMLLWGKI